MGGLGAGGVARSGLYLLLGLFGSAMSPRSASQRPKHVYRGAKRCFISTGVNFKPISTFYVVLSMGPIVSVVTLHGQQNLL